MAGLNTRLIVKNLPKTVTEAKIRSVFSEKGTVTDVQLKYKSDGQFRGFAFIGFKNPEEAEAACNYFDKTFFGTSKIQVESCAGLGDPSKPRAWSKHAPEHQELANKLKRKKGEITEEGDDEGIEKKPKKKKKEEEILEKCREDPEFLEFLQSHRQKSTWGNDEIIDELERQVQTDNTDKSKKVKPKEDVKEVKTKQKGEKESKKPKGDKVFFTIKLQDVPKKAKKKDIKAFFAPLVPKTIRIPRKFLGIAYVGFRTEEERAKSLHKHKSFLLGSKIYIKTLNLPNLSSFEAEQTKLRNSRWTEQQAELEKECEPVSESGRIYIRNLSYLTNEDEIRSIFEPYGPVTEVNLPLDKITRRIKGFGFVTFMLPEHALTAFSNLDGTVFQGRMLHLLPAKNKIEHEDEKSGGSSYKNAKALKQKKSASSSHNWNTLFLGQNAVAQVAADKYGLSKEELLLDHQSDEKDKNQTSIGVRMALAEAEIVDDTKRFLESNGVSLAAFENIKTERSRTCMLVKNLQGVTTAQDLLELFKKYGEVGRIVLPKSGVTAIVEFLEPAEARAAFKKLAYSKFGGMPLYLEWAPVDVFSQGSEPPSNNTTQENNKKEGSTQDTKAETPKEKSPPKEKAIEEEPIPDDMVPELDTTLFVKNLNFDTNEAALKKYFSQVGPIFNATIATKRDSKHPGKTLSMGYGFVQFYRAKDMSKALISLQGTMFQNHVLELKRSNRTLQSDSTVQRRVAGVNDADAGTKLLVRNVPFQTSQQELTDLFKTFGEIKAIRLPLKLDGSGYHRGFAFIEYFAEHEAKRALDTLAKSTHLYGRRLVIEWASKDQTLEELRQKTALQYRLQNSGAQGDEVGETSTKKKLARYFSANPPVAKNDDDD